MIKRLCLLLIVCYQKVISPFMGKNCRFFPSCSEYAYESIRAYGIIKGGVKSIKRIFSCHPFNLGGVDYP